MHMLEKVVHFRAASSRGALAASALAMALVAQVVLARAANGSPVLSALRVLQGAVSRWVVRVDAS